MAEEFYFYDIGYWKNGLQEGYGRRNYNGKVDEGIFE